MLDYDARIVRRLVESAAVDPVYRTMEERMQHERIVIAGLTERKRRLESKLHNEQVVSAALRSALERERRRMVWGIVIAITSGVAVGLCL